MVRGSIVRRSASHGILPYVDGCGRWGSLGAVTRKEADPPDPQRDPGRHLSRPQAYLFRQYAKEWLDFHRANAGPRPNDCYRAVSTATSCRPSAAPP